MMVPRVKGGEINDMATVGRINNGFDYLVSVYKIDLKELAAKIRVSRATLSGWRSGGRIRPYEDNLKALLKELRNMKVVELQGLSDSQCEYYLFIQEEDFFRVPNTQAS